MMKRYYGFIITLLFLAASCATEKVVVQPQVSVTPFSDTLRLTKESLIYALPQTLLEVDVTLQRTIRKPGPYAAFAADLIGITDIIRNDDEEWSLNSVSIKVLEEIDPSEFYVIRSDGMMQNNSLSLKRYGLILDISANNMIDRLTGLNEAALHHDDIRFRDMGSTSYFAIQRDTAFRLVDADTTFIRIPYLVERRRPLTREQLAEQAAKTLLELREGRHLILTGEANVYPQGEAPINEINRLEREYLALFTGKTSREQVNLKYYITPRQGVTQESIILFRLSEMKGLVDDSEANAVPVTLNLTAAGKTKPLVLPNDLQLMTSAPDGVMVYRIPEVVEVTIREGNSILLTGRTVVHQYGQKVTLPMNFLIGN
jgi:hypothetical protein